MMNLSAIKRLRMMVLWQTEGLSHDALSSGTSTVRDPRTFAGEALYHVLRIVLRTPVKNIVHVSTQGIYHSFQDMFWRRLIGPQSMVDQYSKVTNSPFHDLFHW